MSKKHLKKTLVQKAQPREVDRHGQLQLALCSEYVQLVASLLRDSVHVRYRYSKLEDLWQLIETLRVGKRAQSQR